MMIGPIIGLIVGVLIGIESKEVLPMNYSAYVAILILACIDSVLGGIRAILKEDFDLKIFVSGFFGNGILATGLIFLGNQLNIQLSIAAIVVYGGRVFGNFGEIRRIILKNCEKKSTM